MSKNISLYIKDENMRLFDEAERLGEGSMIAGLVEILQERFPETEDYMTTINWVWSKKHKQEQIQRGEIATQEGICCIPGAVPPELFAFKDSEIPNTSIIIGDSKASVKLYNPYVYPSRITFDSDNAPNTWDWVLSVLKSLKEEAEIKEEQEKAEKEKEEQEKEEEMSKRKLAVKENLALFRNFVEKKGSEHLKTLMIEGYEWIEDAQEAYFNDLISQSPFAQASLNSTVWGIKGKPSLKAIRLKKEIEAWLSEKVFSPLQFNVSILRSRPDENDDDDDSENDDENGDSEYDENDNDNDSDSYDNDEKTQETEEIRVTFLAQITEKYSSPRELSYYFRV